MNYVIRDNSSHHRYEIDVDGIVAFSAYRRADGIVTFTHTVVPDALEGRGIGSALAHGALEAVRTQGDKVIAECPFIAAYIAKHPEFHGLLAPGRSEHDKLDAKLDEALDETFPASDPPAVTPKR
jgi:predicted GNAT family acetyltransferase